MAALAIRDDVAPDELRRRARRERVSARLIALANALEGMDRASAARLAGMDRQTLRGWVHRYSAQGIAGLFNRPLPGRLPNLTEGGVMTIAGYGDGLPPVYPAAPLSAIPPWTPRGAGNPGV